MKMRPRRLPRSLQWSPNGRISRSPWLAGLVSAANINNGNNIREPPAFSADWTGLATSEAGRAS